MMRLDGRDRAMCQIVTKRDKMGILEFLNEENDKNLNSAHLPPSKRRLKRAGEKTAYSGWICDFLLEREHILSKIPGNRTVEILRSKRESRSTRRGQRVGTGFLEFRQTP